MFENQHPELKNWTRDHPADIECTSSHRSLHQNRLVRVWRVILMNILVIYSIILLLLIAIFWQQLFGITIILLLNIAMTNFGSVLGIVINCRTTILCTSMITLLITLILLYFPLLPFEADTQILVFGLTLFFTLLGYGFTIKARQREEKFVWASPDQEDAPFRRRSTIVQHIS